MKEKENKKRRRNKKNPKKYNGGNSRNECQKETIWKRYNLVRNLCCWLLIRLKKKQGKLTLIAKSNALRRAAKGKEQSVKEIDDFLQKKYKELSIQQYCAQPYVY